MNEVFAWVSYFAVFLVVWLIVSGKLVWHTHKSSRARHIVAGKDSSETEKICAAYGHEFDAVSSVRKQLPPPPTGYFWELGVRWEEVPIYSENPGTAPYLFLSLFRISDNATVERYRTRIDIMKGERKLWRIAYKKYPASGEAQAKLQLVTEPVAWAHAQAMRFGNPPEHTEVIG